MCFDRLSDAFEYGCMSSEATIRAQVSRSGKVVKRHVDEASWLYFTILDDPILLSSRYSRVYP